MGIYLNPGNERFRQIINSEIYVDKTGLLNYTNKVLNTMQCCLCVSRPRRFGKSMAAAMLAAYYDCECDSRTLFSRFEIAKSSDFETYCGRYDTVFINMQDFLSQAESITGMLALLQKSILWDLLEKYPDLRYFDYTNLPRTMQDIHARTKRPFIFIIDEWDCIFREYKTGHAAQEQYLDFLRTLIKDKAYIHLAYMTGILPIKKYGTHSALNMFDEFTMLDPGPLAPYIGFTQQESESLCIRYGLDIEEAAGWYDGYSFETEPHIYSPHSIVSCMLFGKIRNYWNQTETFEALQFYISLNFNGLKDDVLRMIAGERIPVHTGHFANDMASFQTKDDVLTLLVHLGYLGYDSLHQCVFIPNSEVRCEYVNAVSVSDWGEVSEALKHSSDTLEAIWQKRPKQVAESMKQAHFETSHIQYNDENALSYTISLALYAARNFYTIHREFAGGKGFADLVFLPKKRFPEIPALAVELKWNKTAAGALNQIKQKEYCKSLEEYHGNLLLIGINYDKATKEHECIIEDYKKD